MTINSGRISSAIDQPSTLVELLRQRALYQPDKLAYTFLLDGESEELRLTYGELDQQARAIGAMLQGLGAAGKPVLLLYPQGLAYMAAFFGCLYAGAIAVPTYPPRPNQKLTRLYSIVEDARAAVALTDASVLGKAEASFDHDPKLKGLRLLSTDDLDLNLGDAWQEPSVSSRTLAFLQYTSGSTSAPKGVMVSHGNLLHNHETIQRAFEHPEQSAYVSWLPLFHDMGLVGNALQAVYVGVPCVLMSPMAFLQRPVRWLQAISRYRAATSGGPNFAYDLCVRKVTPEQRQTLDLSSWGVAFNGAEPVRKETLERFAEAFAPCGFRRAAFYPCYGMAEATLMITGGAKASFPHTLQLEGAALEQNRVSLAAAVEAGARTNVSCGWPRLGQQIAIVNPETLRRCAEDEIGEIWVSGESIGQGYWNREEETEHSFHALTIDTGEGPFLRTGDLGFLKDGELYITGRLKDLIIIDGSNHYPQDIERTVEQSHPAINSGGCAAFAVEVGGEEKLVVAAEVSQRHWKERGAAQTEPDTHNQTQPSLDAPTIVRAIRRMVAENHDLTAHSIALLKRGSIPKTSSGKIQRRACREQFLGGTLRIWESCE
ncbi:MAG: fatty acyl-AMP ligase [Pyrinomonadaceae bacterium]